MRSIRTTLTASVLAGVLGSVLLAGFVVHARVGSALLAAFDAAQAAKARALCSQLEVEGGRIEFHYAPGLCPEYECGDRPEYFQMALEDGAILEQSDTLEGAELPVRFGPTERPECFDLVLPDGRAGRAAGILVALEPPGGFASAEDARNGPRLAVVVARDRRDLDRALAAVRGALGAAASMLLLAVVAVVYACVKCGLRPLDALGRELDAVDAKRLTARVGRGPLPVELWSTAAKVNELLERLEAAFAREQRMTGNVAHELRTPISELRAAVEVARRWPDDAGLQVAALETAHHASVRMGTTVAALLRLARLASGAARLELADADLREVEQSAWQSVAAAAARRGVTIASATEPGWRVRTDRALLELMVHNLVENAAAFADPGSTVDCRFEAPVGAGPATWIIANRASGLTEGDLPRLTEPFWRKDGARADERHSGLGLALASGAAEALAIELSFRIGERFEARLAFAASSVLRAAPATSPRRSGSNGTAGRSAPRPG